jgi:hypothetical protein
MLLVVCLSIWAGCELIEYIHELRTRRFWGL